VRSVTGFDGLSVQACESLNDGLQKRLNLIPL
jgi:hypothetical protein